jgi:microcystin-dependent protein
MSDQFIAEIRIVPFNFAPTGWAFCNGQLMPISQNTALFSLLGTYYGGDGKSTFALPNLLDRVPVHQGQGQGLSERFLGEYGGSEFVTLLQSEIPAHTHGLNASTLEAEDNDPIGLVPSLIVGGTLYDTANTNGVQMAFETLSLAGGSQPHNNMQPYLTLNFIIAMQGVFPPRP